jgi:hypothetical protein
MQVAGLPNTSTATTPNSAGSTGYAYSIGTLPGNQTVYALAGLEELTDSGQTVRFEAFAMGVVRGVPVLPHTTTTGVDIPMTTLLDRTVTLTPEPPAPTPRGPDRLISTLAIDLGAGKYALLPRGYSLSLLPVAGAVAFVGMPALDGTLAGASYNLAVQAVSGASHGNPVSVVSGVETTDANDPMTLGGFFGIPTLVQPSMVAWSGTHVQLQASGPIDLAVLTIASGGGLVTWQIVAPGANLSFDLPDISRVPGVASLQHGPLSATFSIARTNGFQYGQLRSGQLDISAWSAYAQDVAQSSY